MKTLFPRLIYLVGKLCLQLQIEFFTITTDLVHSTINIYVYITIKKLLKVKAMDTILCLTLNILQLCNLYTRAPSVFEPNLGIVLGQRQITYAISSFTIIIFNIYIFTIHNADSARNDRPMKMENKLVTCSTTSGSHVRTKHQN